jgi:hypothetical protein
MWYRWVKRIKNAFGERHRLPTASDTVESFERCIIAQAITVISIGINQDKVTYLLQIYLLWLAKPPSRKELSISRLIWSAA